MKKLKKMKAEKKNGIASESKQDEVVLEERSKKVAPKKVVKEYKPPVLYPSRFQRDCQDDQLGKLSKLFKQLHINISFVEILS